MGTSMTTRRPKYNRDNQPHSDFCHCPPTETHAKKMWGKLTHLQPLNANDWLDAGRRHQLGNPQEKKAQNQGNDGGMTMSERSEGEEGVD